MDIEQAREALFIAIANAFASRTLRKNQFDAQLLDYEAAIRHDQWVIDVAI